VQYDSSFGVKYTAMVTSALKTLIDADVEYSQACQDVKQLAPCQSIKLEKYLSAQQEKTDKEQMKARGISSKKPILRQDDDDEQEIPDASNDE
jgi:hypothetical protein